MSIKVLSACAEATPLAKTGGLADVCASLPRALRETGLDVRVLLPGYRFLLEALDTKAVGRRFQPLVTVDKVRLLKGTLPGSDVPVYVIDSPALYDRPGGPYQDAEGIDFTDNQLRFGVLCKVAAMFGSKKGFDGWKADVVHGHDWHAGLTSAYLKFDKRATAASVFTIHNLAYQGNFDRKVRKALGIDSLGFHMDGLEFFGHLSFMKAGIYYADRVTTVSPTYAQEIQTEAHGAGMDGVLSGRSDGVTGILNGIDPDLWDPSSDAWLPARYSADDLSGKLRCKLALQEKMGLKRSEDMPLLGMISRVTHQKGWDLVLEGAADLLDDGAQIVLAGHGEEDFGDQFKRLKEKYPEQFAVHIGFDESVAHMIEAGADIFLMPSRFEPSGLNQMYSQRYGTPPVVCQTGGLKDSVVDADAAAIADGTGTGFVFRRANTRELVEATQRAMALYRDDRDAWLRLQKTGMAQDYSWNSRAAEYIAVYESALEARRLNDSA